MNRLCAITLPLLAGHALAQLPAPTLTQRIAPRAAWTSVASAGTTTPAGTPPAIPAVNTTFRADSCGASSSDKLWVFGGSLGNNTTTVTNDLWAFDAVAGTFTQVVPHGAAGSPPARSRHTAAWNPITNKLVVFGGNTRGATPTLLNDIWEFDPTSSTWTDVTPASGNPTPRQFMAMAFEPNLGAMVMFGGQTNDAAPNVNSNETWLFLGGAWLPMSPPNMPAARGQHSMMTRPDFNDVLMCGGIDNGIATPEQIRFLDVWRWNGSNWNLLSNCDVLTNPTGSGTTWPANVNANQAVYDPLRKRIVMQGGQGITVATNTVYVYGPSYGGSPSNYTSEFDCVTNTWSIYANPTTGATPFANNDPVLGRVSRYYAGFVAATGKVYKACGQNPNATGSKPAFNVYAYQADPLAEAQSYGAGCVGSGGPLSLSTSNLPWTTRTVQATASGLPTGSLGFGAIGLAVTSTPLSTLHPLGGASCNLLVNPIVSLLLLPSGGTAVMNLTMTSDPVFAGVVLNTQVLCMEFDLSFNLTAITSTNGLALRVGAL